MMVGLLIPRAATGLIVALHRLRPGLVLFWDGPRLAGITSDMIVTTVEVELATGRLPL